MEKNKVEQRLVSAAKLVEALPEFFTERNQVIRLAQRRVIPCYVLPGTGRAKRVEYRFSVKDVRRQMREYYQPAV